MLSMLRGKVARAEGNEILLMVGDVLFEIHVTEFETADIEKGDRVALFVHLDISDSAWELYGFADIKERDIFRKLITVRGIGCKTALRILGEITPSQLMSAVEVGDVNYLSLLRGIGKATAEEIVKKL